MELATATRMASLSSTLNGGPTGVRSWDAATRASSSIAGNDGGRHDTLVRGDAKVADEVKERGVVVDEQDPCFTVTDDPEGMGHAPRHRHPMAGSYQCLVVAAAHDHLAFEDVPGVVEIVMDVQRRRRADGQGHLQCDRVHAGSPAVLDHESVEEPPCLGLFAAGIVYDC